MKKNLAIFSVIVSAVIVLISCEKPKALPNYKLGTPVTLTTTPATLTRSAHR